jgi:hypothetical protein
LKVHDAIGCLSDSDQKAIADWLADVAPVPLELFGSLCGLAYRKPATPGRGRLIAHAVRELRSALLWYKVAKESQRVEHDFAALAKEWADSGPSFDTITNATTPDSATATVSITITLATKIHEFVARHGTARDTHAVKIVKLFQSLQLTKRDDTSSLMTLARDWKTLTDYFVRVCHEREKTDHEIIDGTFVDNLHRFEKSLLNFAKAGAFFEGIEDIDKILQDANK